MGLSFSFLVCFACLGSDHGSGNKCGEAARPRQRSELDAPRPAERRLQTLGDWQAVEGQPKPRGGRKEQKKRVAGIMPLRPLTASRRADRPHLFSTAAAKAMAKPRPNTGANSERYSRIRCEWLVLPKKIAPRNSLRARVTPTVKSVKINPTPA